MLFCFQLTPSYSNSGVGGYGANVYGNASISRSSTETENVSPISCSFFVCLSVCFFLSLTHLRTHTNTQFVCAFVDLAIWEFDYADFVKCRVGPPVMSSENRAAHGRNSYIHGLVCESEVVP